MHFDFCTLFFANYLDKGLVLYDSLKEHCESFTLYILAMDDKCYEILMRLDLAHVVPIKYDLFEDDELANAKKQRNIAEFSWTCTPKLIKYIIDKYDAQICTYIDADLFFYKSPQILIEEMLNSNSSVLLVEHNFPKHLRRRAERNAGRICIEFNPFRNDNLGYGLLTEWERDCISKCCFREGEKIMGDQVYVQDWPDKHSYVNVSENQGAGVAPWNVNKFRFRQKDNKWFIFDRESSNEYEMVFFHFQNIKFMTCNEVYCCKVKGEIRDQVKAIYEEYIERIIEKKSMLFENFGIDYIIKKHPGDEYIKDNGAAAFIKRNLVFDGHFSLKEAFLNAYDYLTNKIHSCKQEDLVVSIINSDGK